MAVLFINHASNPAGAYLYRTDAIRASVPLSISVAFAPSSLPLGGGKSIIAIGTNNDRCSYEIQINGRSGPEIQAVAVTTWAHLTANAFSPYVPYVADQLYYITAVWENDSLRSIYLDAESATNTDTVPSLAPWVNYTSIGTRKTYFGSNFGVNGIQGCLHSLTAWSTARSQAEHLAIAAGSDPTDFDFGNIVQLMEFGTPATAGDATIGSNFTTVETAPADLDLCGETPTPGTGISSYVRIMG